MSGNKEPEEFHEEKDESVSVIENEIYLQGPITTRTAQDCCDAIKLLDKAHRRVGTNYEIDAPPIKLIICSSGGEMFAGLSIVDEIRRSATHVNTHISGGAASCAADIALCGRHRSMGKYSYILIHQISAGLFGTFEENQTEIENQKMFMKKSVDFYKERTSLTEEQITEMLKKDVWLNAEQALAFGMIEEII